MVMDLHRTPNGYFASLLGGKSRSKIMDDLLEHLIAEGEPSRKQKGDVEAFPAQCRKKREGREKRKMPEKGEARRRKRIAESATESGSGSNWSEEERRPSKKIRRSMQAGMRNARSSVLSLLREADRSVEDAEACVLKGQRKPKTKQENTVEQSMVVEASLVKAIDKRVFTSDTKASKALDDDAGDVNEKTVIPSAEARGSALADTTAGPHLVLAANGRSDTSGLSHSNTPVGGAKKSRGKRPDRRGAGGAFSTAFKTVDKPGKRGVSGAGQAYRFGSMAEVKGGSGGIAGSPLSNSEQIRSAKNDGTGAWHVSRME